MKTFYKIGNMAFEDYFIKKSFFTKGGLWGWGRNDNGQLGTNDIIHRSSPVQIGNNTNWKLVDGGGYHILAIADNS